MTAAVQTIWCELVAATLADAGIATIVLSPGSRSTPLVAALVAETERRRFDATTFELVTIIDERAAAFYALGAARATGLPVALACTSGTAAAHYLPAIIEAAHAGVPLIAITADRPPELQACGASQTIDQIDLYGRFVRGAFDLGAPVGSQDALRAVRRKVIQAITLARGPIAGPVHLELPLRKPLEPAAPTTDEERALAAFAHALRGPAELAIPRLVADPGALAELVAAIVAEPDGVIVAGAMPTTFDGTLLHALAARAAYPIVAEAGSQLRFGPRGDAAFVDHLDLVPIAQRPTPRLVIQLGAEPVAASWPAWDLGRARRYVLAETWVDPTSSARVVLGDVTTSIEALAGCHRPAPQRVRSAAWLEAWRELDACAARAIDVAQSDHLRSEVAVVRAALSSLPAGAAVQIGNSLPIRVVDQLTPLATAHPVLVQRGAAGIDGLVASAAGATRAGQPVLLVLGDVSFAHDLGGLVAARAATRPLAIVVVDNRGGQIFAGLPVARAGLGAAMERHWLTPPDLDPAAIASALGARAVTAASPAAVGAAVADALATPGLTVIHAPVTASGAHDVRRSALAQLAQPIARTRGVS